MRSSTGIEICFDALCLAGARAYLQTLGSLTTAYHQRTFLGHRHTRAVPLKLPKFVEQTDPPYCSDVKIAELWFPVTAVQHQ